MIVADTSVMVDHLRNDLRAVELLDRVTADGTTVAASVVSRVELLRGMRSQERQATWAMIAAFHWIDVSAAIADTAGTYARNYRDSHASIDPLDFIVAATATETGAVLWTHNVRHFPMFDGLEPPY